MNFYKRHLGDIAKACGHLSQGQQGAYDLLLDWLYGNERPLPVNKEALYRIGRAVTKPERDNVDFVLQDFFTLTDAGYTQKRATEEIAKANAQAETNRRIAEEREARKRGSGHQPGDESFNETPNESFNGSCTNRQPSQTPDSRHQTKASSRASAENLDSTQAGLACQLMREAGCPKTNPNHPELLAALADGVTPEALGYTAAEAIEAGIRKPFAWAIATAHGRHLDGARPV